MFRDATPADIEAIVALVESAYRGESSRAGWTTEADLLDGRRTDADAVGDIVAAPDSRMLLVTTDDGELLGCCQLQRRPSSVAYFGMFAVSPTLQGGGIGHALLAEAERIARTGWGATSMEMTVLTQRRDLIAWYQRRGYQPTGASEPFPSHDRRFGLPRRDDLRFDVLAKPLAGAPDTLAEADAAGA
jgi:ribosomal protein S18 acetylase RimI-like enzyme